MGHTSNSALRSCVRRCPATIPKAVVVTVRDVYHYWQSTYRYGWIGRNSAVMWHFQHKLGHSVASARAGELRSFVHFMRWVRHSGRHFSQSHRIKRSCGRPCVYDHLLRTESLSTGWQTMVEKYGLPHVALPRLNSVGSTQREQPPDATLTPEIYQIINELEQSMFNEFNLTRRGG